MIASTSTSTFTLLENLPSNDPQDSPKRPGKVYMQRQPTTTSSMSNIFDLADSNPSTTRNITTKESSYSFIWIDDHYKNVKEFEEQKVQVKQKDSNISKRGFCNIFTMLFIIVIILCLFIYPFVTLFSNK